MARSAKAGRGRAAGTRARRAAGRRQRVRRLLLTVSFLLFPVTIFYFSPVLVIEGALAGVVAGSMLVFALQFALALAFRRAFCGWLCAAGGLQEIEADAVGKPAKLGWRTRIKYVIWVPWLASIAACAWVAGGFAAVDPLLGIPGGVSLNNPLGLGIYFGIVALFFVPNLFLGRRAMCHCICWMAPFMVLGGKLGRALRIPQLHVGARPETCVECGKCAKACPMSLVVPGLLQGGAIVDAECIQCGACADVCPKDTLALRFGQVGKRSGDA
ncbi:4Fe-4S ferredoxin [Gordonibacter sp. 28C]|uniref:4Fe-4S binding protein n=1 Tax=Gordonibacter sp. 28C TaxID=2078569 RepID=UPI000DF81292|nr:4Fe-4S dicluster domain-containing protein [Gordonibacter sp. 28C]RDB63855.1 4Fe-4S ferredoxin [Gordonibacter sp. 28C]